MLIVTGASGRLGRQTILRLRELVDAAQIVAVSRDPGRAADLGVAVRRGDFEVEDEALVRAFDGAERLLVVSVGGSGRFTRHRRAIDAAVRAGVGHIIFTSFTRAGDPANPSPHMRDFRATEEGLVSSGLPFTALRFNLWPEVANDVGVIGCALASGEWPSNAGNGRVAYIDRDESAAFCAAVLARGECAGQLLEVSGSQALTDAELVGALGRATGRAVRHCPVRDDAIARAWIDLGLSEPLAQGWGALGKVKRDGWFDTTTHAFERIVGRRPKSVEEHFIERRAVLAP